MDNSYAICGHHKNKNKSLHINIKCTIIVMNPSDGSGCKEDLMAENEVYNETGTSECAVQIKIRNKINKYGEMISWFRYFENTSWNYRRILYRKLYYTICNYSMSNAQNPETEELLVEIEVYEIRR